MLTWFGKGTSGSKQVKFYDLMTDPHWGWETHIWVSKLTIIGSDNGLSPGRRQAIIRTSAGKLLIWPLGTNFNEIWSEIHTFSFKKMHLKNLFCEMMAILSQPQCVSVELFAIDGLMNLLKMIALCLCLIIDYGVQGLISASALAIDRYSLNNEIIHQT